MGSKNTMALLRRVILRVHFAEKAGMSLSRTWRTRPGSVVDAAVGRGDAESNGAHEQYNDKHQLAGGEGRIIERVCGCSKRFGIHQSGANEHGDRRADD